MVHKKNILISKRKTLVLFSDPHSWNETVYFWTFINWVLLLYNYVFSPCKHVYYSGGLCPQAKEEGPGGLHNFQTTRQLLVAWEIAPLPLLGGNQLVCTPLCDHLLRACVLRDWRLLHSVLLLPGRYKRAAPSLTDYSIDSTEIEVASSYSGREQH